MEAIETELGPPELLADSSAQVIRGDFLRRHPVFTCLTGPLTATVLLAATYLLLLIAAAWVISLTSKAEPPLSESLPPWTKWSIRAAFQGLSFVPFALAAALCAFLARRELVTTRWALCGTGLVALLAGMFHAALRLPDAPGTGEVSIGLIVGTNLHWIQLTVPCVVAAIMLAYPRHDESICDA